MPALRKYRGGAVQNRTRILIAILPLLSLGFVFANAPLAAQQTSADSLRQILHGRIQGPPRVNAMNMLSGALLESAPDSAMDLAQKSLVLAKNIGYRGGIADALYRKGEVYQFRYRYDQALRNYRQSLAHSGKLGDKRRKVKALVKIAAIQRMQGQNEASMRTYQKSLKYADELNEQRVTAEALMGIGGIHSYQERYQQALKFFNKSLAIYKELGDRRAMVRVLNQIGNKQANFGLYDKALRNHQQALNLARELDDKRGIQQTITYIGIYYRSQGRDEEALRNYDEGWALAKELGDKRAEALCLNLLGDLYSRRGNYKRAVEMWKSAYVILDKIGDIHLLMSVSHWLSNTYSMQGDFKNAYYFEKEKSKLNDSLLNIENVKSINEMSAKYDAEKREQQIALLQKDKELQEVLNYAAIGGVVVLLILAVGLYHRYRYRKQTGEELQRSLDELKRTQQQLIHAEKMATLGELTAGVAHEIKNPLNFITNFSGMNEELATEIEEQVGDNPELKETLELLRGNTAKINEHGLRADRIVNSMLMHSRETKGVRQRTDINALVEEAVELARHGAPSGKDVEIRLALDPEAGFADILPAEISRVILNLVGNAMYSARKHCEIAACLPTVTIGTLRKMDTIVITVADNGAGITHDVREKIFQPFFTTKPTGDGTGLGLSLTWDIVHNGHNGTIEVDSEAGKGAVFIVKLPLG